MDTLNDGVTFVDAQEMGSLYPDSFDVYTDEELNAIKPNDFVKVCLENNKQDGERFWVKVTVVEGNTITGTIDNHLFGALLFGVDSGDTIQFEKRNVYDIIPAEGFGKEKGPIATIKIGR